MKNYAPLILILIIASGCAPVFQAAQQTKAIEHASQAAEIIPPQLTQSPQSSSQQGCVIMKKRTGEEYDCFGCVGNVCKDPDMAVWDDANQDEAQAKGYKCINTPNGCERIIMPK